MHLLSAKKTFKSFLKVSDNPLDDDRKSKSTIPKSLENFWCYSRDQKNMQIKRCRRILFFCCYIGTLHHEQFQRLKSLRRLLLFIARDYFISTDSVRCGFLYWLCHCRLRINVFVQEFEWTTFNVSDSYVNVEEIPQLPNDSFQIVVISWLL